MKPFGKPWRKSREANPTLAALSRMGARNGGMCNICELLINVVIDDRPKVLIGLDQTVRGMVGVVGFRFTRPMIPPANRQALTHHRKISGTG